MKNAKDSKGITLISLIVLIIVLGILSSIAIYSGMGTLRYTRFMSARSQVEIMQTNVNSWYSSKDENMKNYGTQVSYNDYKDAFDAAEVSESDSQTYRLFTPKYLEETLGVNGIDSDFLVSVQEREVILANGVRYQDKMYYTPEDFDLSNIKIDPVTSVSFDLVCGLNPNNLTEEDIFVKDIKFYDSENEVKVSKFVIEYSTDNGTSWTAINSKNSMTELKANESSEPFKAYGIKIGNDGDYSIRIKTNDGRALPTKENKEGENIKIYNCFYPEFDNSNNWYIYTPRQLRFLAEFVNNGNTVASNEKLTEVATNAYNKREETMTTATNINLMSDLDFGARPGEGSTVEEKWEIATNEEKEWTPIGKTKDLTMLGTFDGKKHTIKGIYVNTTDKFNGIFGNSNTIKDLTIEDSYIKGASFTAGIVGYMRAGTLENCHNKNTTVILIEGNFNAVGGVVGQAGGNVSKCNNRGTVISYGYRTDTSQTLAYCGGIAGAINPSTTMSFCNNYGEVKTNGLGLATGGIVGMMGPGTDTAYTTVENCNNFGQVNGISRVGGVVGATGKKCKISKCYNEVAITSAEDRCGGIAGNTSADTKVTECNNIGPVKGTANCIGGIVGISGSTVEKCTNSGTVTGKKELGGIVGQIGYSSSGQAISNIFNCYNTGKIKQEGNDVSGVGGIVGYISNVDSVSGEVSHNYSTGEIQIVGTNVTDVGGAIGHYTGTLFEINNNYYETNKSNVELNSLGEGRDTANMKTQAFVDLLNTNQTPTVWELGTTNNGYPTLKKEQT